MARILSVQSQVAFGHVGNAATVFPLQTLGHEVWPVPTAILSNHAGYRETGGSRVAPGTIADILDGLSARGADARCDLVLSGYMGSAETGGVILEALDRIRFIHPPVLYCCDPVMGDTDTGLYVDDTLRTFFMDKAVREADVLTPNIFELEVLSGHAPGTLSRAPADAVLSAAHDLIAGMRDGAKVLVTSAASAEILPEKEVMIAVDNTGAWRVETPRLEFSDPPHGAGDLASALFAAALKDKWHLAEALEDMTSRLFAVLDETARRDASELALVAARERILKPGRRFRPSQVA